MPEVIENKKTCLKVLLLNKRLDVYAKSGITINQIIISNLDGTTKIVTNPADIPINMAIK